MQVYAPKYYSKFKCIADKCKHNCCIGWEIDIDPYTLQLYNSLEGSFSKSILDKIVTTDDTAYFKLTDSERCPFLNENNLCDIIINLGDGAICDICAEHPRFRNYYEDSCEIGLGLCCEEAARIILSDNDKFEMYLLEASDESEEVSDINININNSQKLLTLRDDIIAILSDRTKTLKEKLHSVLALTNSTLPQKIIKEWVDIFSALEEMDTKRNYYLEEIKNFSDFETKFLDKSEGNFELYLSNLAIYFIYRHFAKVLEGVSLQGIINFSIISLSAIVLMCKVEYDSKGNVSIEDLIQCARLYSSEIEYSEENTYELLNILE